VVVIEYAYEAVAQVFDVARSRITIRFVLAAGG
jgi:hypothetical protein